MSNTRELKFNKKLLVKLEKEQHDFLQKFSEERQTTMSELVRDLIAQLKYFDEIKQPTQEPRNLLKEFLA